MVDLATADDLAFRFVTTRTSLALTATVGERWRRRIERLRTPADLARWFVAAGLLAEPPPVRAVDLAAARELREAAYRCAVARIAGDPLPVADVATVNAAAAGAPLVPRLARGAVHWTGDAPAALGSVARDAVDLLGGADAGRLRECGSPTCGLLFVDTSRPGARRWCSSTACGGAARSAAYRRRVAGS